MIEDFHRIKRLPPYVFDEVNRLKAAARARGADIIDLGMGNPDLPTPPHIVDEAGGDVAKPRTHRYSASKGIPGLRKAQAAYYERRFGVKLDPDTQVVATLGSKEGFANMAQAITAPGDVMLVPNPTLSDPRLRLPHGGRGRAACAGGDGRRVLARGRTRRAPLDPQADWRSWSPIRRTRRRWWRASTSTRMSWRSRRSTTSSSCPTSPTAELYFDGNPPPSVLQVPGAMDITVEFTSLSKTYSMPGWRMGFAVGNERLIAALARVKSYLDYGAFTPIQVAAAAALNGPQDCVDEIRETYKARRDCLVESFGRAGWDIPPPPASMFAWAPIPEPFRHLGSVEFSKLLIEKADVAVSPGIGFGEYGEGYVRIALVENEQRIRQAARNVKKFFSQGAETTAQRGSHSAQSQPLIRNMRAP